jgi:iron complex transport system substrate-binding protein
LDDEIVAVTHECDYPQPAESKPRITESIMDHLHLSSAAIDHHVSSNIGRHGGIYRLREDMLETLEPDLIITQELCDVCAVSFSEVQRAARILEGQTRIVSLEPNTLDDVLETIRLVGEVTGRKETAERKVNELRTRLDHVRELVRGASPRRVYAMEWLDPPFSAGHWVPEMVEIAGGIEVLGQSGAKSLRIRAEDIATAQPEVIILMPCGFSLQRTVEEYGRVVSLPGWQDLPAIRNGELYAVDGSAYFNRPGPRLVDGVEILARILHPDRASSAVPPNSFRKVL